MEHLSVAIADDNQRILDLMEEIINMDKELNVVGKPTTVPIHPPMPTVQRATRQVVPVPLITRLKISLPKLSVPKMCAKDGAWFFNAASIAVGSYGVQKKLRSAIKSTTPVMTIPMIKFQLYLFFISYSPCTRGSTN